MDCKFSLAPFGEPGSVMMIELFRTPATGLDMIPTMEGQLTRSLQRLIICLQGVTAKDAASMPCTSPGACLCNRGSTAFDLSEILSQ